MKKAGVIVRKPEIVWQEDKFGKYARIKELASIKWGAKVSMAEVTLYGPDVLHHHEESQEIYICMGGRGYLYVEGFPLISFRPGDGKGEVDPVIVIINPGLLHAAMPEHPSQKLVFLCISSPSFKPEDFIPHETGREWYKKLEARL